jgi:uncharacterized caspase-like protein
MRRLVYVTCLIAACSLSGLKTGLAAERLALLIGNEHYNEKVGALKNPHNDITLVGDALEKVGFKTTRVPDADFLTLHKVVKAHIARVRQSGPGTISFIYYSGHGASDASTGLNYLIPVNVADADDSSLWQNSVELKADVVDKIATQAPEATHFLVFDACRNELQLRIKGVKALEIDGKGFKAFEQPGPILISYATAPGRTASDVGAGSGPYARALSEELVRPGVEAVTLFRNVQLRVMQSIGQNPWMTVPSVQAIYLAGEAPTAPPTQSPKEAFERERASQVKTLQAIMQQLNDRDMLSGGLFYTNKKWPKRSLEMCFLDGSRARRAYVASVARQWTLYGEIVFDFGSWDDPRECEIDEPRDVAITFDRNAGNWSFMGTDAAKIPLDRPTLALASIGLADEQEVLVGRFNREILREFGHVLGFGQSWQAPASGGQSSCDEEVDWDRVYKDLSGPPQYWSRATVDRNMKAIGSPQAVTGKFDTYSIMNYEYPPEWLRRGRESRCFATPLSELSLRDKLAVSRAYN